MLWCARVYFLLPQNNMSSSEAVMTSPTASVSNESRLSLYNQTQPEKPFHYTYLKEFRVEQCPLFLQHKCTAHRPFTCFHWHFMNQRRRRPKKKRDGTFNYSPDVYCTQYDETTGICPSGDDCPYLHRVAGDVERRYHLRYYKTATCVYETDSRGYCVKNGPHCAFAHGPHDLRQPVYDVRELQAMEKEEVDGQQGVENKAVIEDPRWQDTNFVLSNYKTEPCKKPPRLCRQGYACPYYHNTRDRRRSPRKVRYRSTPCPHVKHSDEWGEPSNCESGDNCPYCHTRTEQQFHPEIYKSTKCNDMQQTGYCPRGPFCAFAHVDQESVVGRELSETDLNMSFQQLGFPQSDTVTSLLQPICKPVRSMSTSSAGSGVFMENTQTTGSYAKAPGSERSERSSSREEDHQAMIRRHLLSIENDPSLDDAEKARRKQTLITSRASGSSSSTSSAPLTPSSISASAAPFYPAADTVESVVESALDDLNLDDFDVTELEKELNNASPCSTSLGDSLTSLSIATMCSAPVSIPGTGSPHSYTPQSPTSPLGQYTSSYGSQKQANPYRASSLVRSSLHGSIFDPLTTQLQSPKSLNSPQLHSPLDLTTAGEVHRMGEELMAARSKLASWEDSWVQAKQACDAWKKEAEESIEKAKSSQADTLVAVMKKEAAENQVLALKQEIECLQSDSHIQSLNKKSELKDLPLERLKQLHHSLSTDLEEINKVICYKQAYSCSKCQEKPRSVVTLPCTHLLLCEECAAAETECPHCHIQITQRNTVTLP
ncbi:RING finger protein unkempt homolog [Nematostella vectensis]|uniref:RING finger protein unkempt homolog n=1 Tax=Nematostella vectensis TaxID=45351 RepID=UPI002077851A|nr:RING finger protein unkempt homolog [Nematostella vectensis]